MKNKIISIITAGLMLLAVLAALTSCDVTDGKNTVIPSETGNASGDNSEAQSGGKGILGDFTASGLNGTEYTETVLSGYDVNMINIWATYCGPCIREMPDLGELADEYKDRGVQIIGIVSDAVTFDGKIDDGQVALALEIVDETGADYTHMIAGDGFNTLMSRIYAVPTTIFVDGNGSQIGEIHVGSMDKAGWAAVIDEILNEAGEKSEII